MQISISCLPPTFSINSSKECSKTISWHGFWSISRPLRRVSMKQTASLMTLIAGMCAAFVVSVVHSKFVKASLAAAPAFPGLCLFPQGRNFKQWTGNNSKALMKVCAFVHSQSLCNANNHCFRSLFPLLPATSWPGWFSASWHSLTSVTSHINLHMIPPVSKLCRKTLHILMSYVTSLKMSAYGLMDLHFHTSILSPTMCEASSSLALPTGSVHLSRILSTYPQ